MEQTPEQPKTDDELRDEKIGRVAAAIHSFGARWPWVGNMVSVLPQVTGGSFGIKELVASTGAAANAIAAAAGTAMMASVHLVSQAATGGWPFHHRENPAEPPMSEQNPLPPEPPR